jgi:hypothetical protein
MRTVETIKLLDDGMLVEFGWPQIFAYLGYRNIIASALTARLFRRAFEDLAPTGPADRDELFLLTAFPGPGILEAVELVTRVPTRHPDRLVIDKNAGPAGAPLAPNGRFYFELQVGQNRRGYWPPEAIFDDLFRDMVKRYQTGGGTEEEQLQYRTFKQNKAEEILGWPEEELFASCHVST